MMAITTKSSMRVNGRTVRPTDPAWNNGDYSDPHACKNGLKRLAHVFALMGLCPEFYKQEQWKKIGFDSMQEMLAGFWQAWFQPMDPNALLVQAKKWQEGDSCKHAGGDLVQALNSSFFINPILEFNCVLPIATSIGP